MQADTKTLVVISTLGGQEASVVIASAVEVILDVVVVGEKSELNIEDDARLPMPEYVVGKLLRDGLSVSAEP